MSTKGWVDVVVAALLTLVVLSAAQAHPKEAHAKEARGPGVTLVFGSQPGRPTLDQDALGGNPFATALIEVLQREPDTLAAFLADLETATAEASAGFQRIDVLGGVASRGASSAAWPGRGQKVALVVGYSDYLDPQLNSLPGVAHDLFRVSRALSAADFATTTILNPSRDILRAALRAFKRSSRRAGTALLYVTGHAAMLAGTTFLLPTDVSLQMSERQVPRLGVSARSLAAHLNSPGLNLFLFGGCRDNPFGQAPQRPTPQAP